MTDQVRAATDRIVTLGTFQAEGRAVTMNHRPNTTTAWLVVQSSTLDFSELGTVKGLDLDEPELVIFQRHQRWCAPWTRWHIARQARELYRRGATAH